MGIKNIYIAGTFSSRDDRKSLTVLIHLVRHKYPNADVFVPMEHKVEGDYQLSDGSWFLPNDVWAVECSTWTLLQLTVLTLCLQCTQDIKVPLVPPGKWVMHMQVVNLLLVTFLPGPKKTTCL